MVFILENLFQLSAIILVLCSWFYYRHFKQTKKERKLTIYETMVYIVTRIAMYLCAASYVLLFLHRNFG